MQDLISRKKIVVLGDNWVIPLSFRWAILHLLVNCASICKIFLSTCLSKLNVGFNWVMQLPITEDDRNFETALEKMFCSQIIKPPSGGCNKNVASTAGAINHQLIVKFSLSIYIRS